MRSPSSYTPNFATIAGGRSHPTSSSNHGDTLLPVIEWCGVRVVTTDSLAAGYGTTENSIHKNLSNNRDRFVEGVHIHTVRGVALRAFRNQVNHVQLVSKHTTSRTLWTEPAVARMSKITDVDRAWYLPGGAKDCTVVKLFDDVQGEGA